MVYYANYPIEHSTIKVVVNLNDSKETRTCMNKYYKKGNDNMYL